MSKNTTVIYVQLSEASVKKVHRQLDAIKKKLIAIRKEYSKLKLDLKLSSKFTKGCRNAG